MSLKFFDLDGYIGGSICDRIVVLLVVVGVLCFEVMLNKECLWSVVVFFGMNVKLEVEEWELIEIICGKGVVFSVEF